MLIIIAELAFIIWLSKKLSNDNSKIKAITLFAIFEQTIILLVYRINLNTINRVVYYSDAEVYWDNTLTLLNGGHLIGSQTGYAYYCMLLQLVSPFVSVIWNNISNICLLDCSVLLLAHVMVLGSVSQKNILLFLRFNLYNPLIIYGLGRNLKDSLFLFIIVVVVYT